MKKVVNITLGGMVFAAEQDAFDALSRYLDSVRTSIAKNGDESEVVEDIERAIAEKFIVKKRSDKMAVTANDVEAVVKEMGTPDDFDSAESDAAASQAAESVAPNKKQLYRDTDEAIIAGVASGIAQYFNIDPVIVRLLFVVGVFFNGLGIFAYVVLWLIVPAAKTTADRFAMRGDRVTLKEITERVKKNLDEVDTKRITDEAKSTWGGVRPFLVTFFDALGKFLWVIIKLASYIIGVACIVLGSLGIAGLFLVYGVLLLSDKVFFPHDVQIALEILQSGPVGVVAMISSSIMMAIPLLVLIVSGTSLLAKKNYFTVGKSVTLAVVFIVSLVVAGTSSALQVEQVMQKIGPVEGRFSDSYFELRWHNGVIQGDEHQVRFESRDPQ